jgi:two-component system KDP operon response regulator KdpE
VTERRRVLVIEDDPLLHRLIGDVLTEAGCEVRVALDGKAGLALLRSWRPDAIVLDVALPDGDAPAFRAAQLHAGAAAGVPVLLVSATRADQLEKLAGELGAAAWLAKPFAVDDLVAAVARLAGG